MLLWALGIGLAAITTLFCVRWVQDPLWIGFMDTIGVGLLPVATFLMIYEFDTRKAYQELVRSEFSEALSEVTAVCGDCHKSGLAALTDSRPKERLETFFSEAPNGSTLSVLGVALRDFLAVATEKAIIEAVRRGCNVRFLYLDPSSAAATTHSLNEGRAPDEVRDDIKGGENTWRRLKAEAQRINKGTFEGRKYDSIPAWFMLISPDGICVGPYLRKNRGNVCPHIAFKAGSLLEDRFRDHFESLWQTATPI